MVSFGKTLLVQVGSRNRSEFDLISRISSAIIKLKIFCINQKYNNTLIAI